MKQLFLSRDVPNIHQKFTQGTHGCLVKDFISLEEKTQKNNRISNFLGGGSVQFSLEAETLEKEGPQKLYFKFLCNTQVNICTSIEMNYLKPYAFNAVFLHQ